MKLFIIAILVSILLLGMSGCGLIDGSFQEKYKDYTLSDWFKQNPNQGISDGNEVVPMGMIMFTPGF